MWKFKIIFFLFHFTVCCNFPHRHPFFFSLDCNVIIVCVQFNLHHAIMHTPTQHENFHQELFSVICAFWIYGSCCRKAFFLKWKFYFAPLWFLLIFLWDFFQLNPRTCTKKLRLNFHWKILVVWTMKMLKGGWETSRQIS